MRTKYPAIFVLLAACACISIYLLAWSLFLVMALDWTDQTDSGIPEIILVSAIPGTLLGLSTVAVFMMTRRAPTWMSVIVFSVLPYVLIALSVVGLFWLGLILTGAAIFSPASLVCYIAMSALIERYPPHTLKREVGTV